MKQFVITVTIPDGYAGETETALVKVAQQAAMRGGHLVVNQYKTVNQEKYDDEGFLITNATPKGKIERVA